MLKENHFYNIIFLHSLACTLDGPDPPFVLIAIFRLHSADIFQNFRVSLRRTL